MAPPRATTVAVSRLTPAERRAAWELFDAHYADADRARFERDLDDKQQIVLLHAGDRLVGFSTIRVDRLPFEGRCVVSIFSGDTVIEAAHRGSRALQWAFFRCLLTTKLRHPRSLVVWFLLSKGYKTYLLLARNFPTCWPRRDTPTPGWAHRLICALAARRYAEALDRDALILRFPGDHERLRDHVAPLHDLTDPDIRFFAERNPGHADGDELCCLGVVDRRLLLAFPLKVLRGTAR